MDIGIKAKDIMEEGFPIIDSNATLEECMDQLNRSEWDVCVVLNHGIIYSILDSDDLVREYLRRGDKRVAVRNLGCSGRFAIVKADTDLFKIIEKMKEGTEYFIVKENPSIGLITKERLAEKNHLAFEARKKVVR